MMMPAMNLPALPITAASNAVLDFPADGIFGAALPALAVLAIGVSVVSLLRARRAAQRPTPVPSSATH